MLSRRAGSVTVFTSWGPRPPPPPPPAPVAEVGAASVPIAPAYPSVERWTASCRTLDV